MIISFLVVLLSLPFQDQVVMKPDADFELGIDYKFKQRTGFNDTSVHVDFSTDDLNAKPGGEGPLPYLIINFKFIKLKEDEVRVRVVNNLGKLVYSGKAKVGDSFKLDLGFTDDMKDRVTAFGYDINFINDNKDIVSRATLLIMDDGTFLVNGEKRGKF